MQYVESLNDVFCISEHYSSRVRFMMAPKRVRLIWWLTNAIDANMVIKTPAELETERRKREKAQHKYEAKFERC